MKQRKNNLLELFGRVIADKMITPDEFMSLCDWFESADPPLKRDEALFCLTTVSEAAFTALKDGKLAMPSHDVAAFMYLLWKSGWEKFCPVVKSTSNRVVFHQRWVPMKKLIAGAQKTLDIAVFNFGADSMIRLLQAKADKGVLVRIFTEGDNVRSVPRTLAGLRGVTVKKDCPDRNMHHKFIVADGREVLTGSMNFTYTGIEKSHEGYIITDHPDIVLPYVHEFENLWEAGMNVELNELITRNIRSAKK